MQENNFEKQIQQKIDDLKLKPSDEVWQKVAVAIAKRKSYRKIWAIVFLLLLCISSAVIVLFNRRPGREIKNKTISEKSNLSKANKNPGSKEGNMDSAFVKSANVYKQQVTKNAGNQPKLSAVEMPNKVAGSVAVNAAGSKSQDVKLVVRNNKNRVTYTSRPKLTTVISNANPVDLTNEKNNREDANTTIAIKLKPFISDNAIKDSVTDSTIGTGIVFKKQQNRTLAVVENNATNKLAPGKKSVRLNEKNGWKIGVNFSAGIAATKNGYLGIITPGGGNELKAYDNLSTSNGSTANPGTPISYIPSKVKAGVGFGLGVFVQKGISRKTNFLIGLNYKTYTSSMKIGDRVDSSNNYSRNNFFYRSGVIRSYKNNFHFLEVPVAVQIKLGKQTKLPVYLKTGISISQLLGSSALQFEPMTGAYYSDNALFNKTQMSMSAALLFSLPGNANNPFLIGPDMNFSLTKMANSGLYNNRHYSYFGILVQKNISKK